VNRLLVVGVLFLFVSSSVISISGFDTEQSIKHLLSGKTLYVGGSGEGNYTKIQDAIDIASDGDSVFVYNGTYVENVIIKKAIHLIGENKNTTIVDGSTNGSVIDVRYWRITITGFTVQNSGNEPPYDSGIEVEGCYIEIHNNTVKSNHNGILIFASYMCNVTNNFVTSNYYGIVGAGARMYGNCTKITIEKNIVSHCEYGIYCVYGFDTGIISNNHIIHNKYGLSMITACNNKCTRNNITKNNVGLYCGMSFCNFSQNNFIKNFRQAKCSWYPTLIGSGGGFFIINNNFWGRPRNYPKPIFGIRIIIPFPLIIIPWIGFDWHPAQEPYDIEV
jgi:parallel beta-helix repeat protein